jgi:hypothetical protein
LLFPVAVGEASSRGAKCCRERLAYSNTTPAPHEYVFHSGSSGRLAGSVGDRPTGGKVTDPVVWVAFVEERKRRKPTDKAILGMVSPSPGRNERELGSGLDQIESEGRAPMVGRRQQAMAQTDRGDRSLRRGGRDSTVPRTGRATGEAVLVPLRNEWGRVGPMTGSSRKVAARDGGGCVRRIGAENRSKVWGATVSRRREQRHAVREVRVDASKPPCRGRFQTAISCYGLRAAVVNVMVKRHGIRSRHVGMRGAGHIVPIFRNPSRFTIGGPICSERVNSSSPFCDNARWRRFARRPNGASAGGAVLRHGR